MNEMEKMLQNFIEKMGESNDYSRFVDDKVVNQDEMVNQDARADYHHDIGDEVVEEKDNFSLDVGDDDDDYEEEDCFDDGDSEEEECYDDDYELDDCTEGRIVDNTLLELPTVLSFALAGLLVGGAIGVVKKILE